MKKADFLRLLITEKSENDAEALAKVLCDAGHSIEFDYIADIAAFESALAERKPDIILCGKNTRAITPQAVMDLLLETGLSVPVIVITKDVSEKMVAAARKSGIEAIVSSHSPEHLSLEVSRVQTHLEMQQKLARLETALGECENRCSMLVDNSSEAIAIIDADLNWHPNQSCIDLFGFSDSDAAVKNPFIESISKEMRGSFVAFLRSLEDGSSQEHILEISCRHQDGPDFECVFEFMPATTDGDFCTQALIRACQPASHEEDADVKESENIDALTRLYNRQHFMELLDEDVDKSADEGGVRALIYLTLDGFKEVREEHGIAASDKALCSIARLFENHCDTRDSIARFGDFSYTILYHADSSEKIQAMGEKLLHEIPSHLTEVYGESLSMTCSIGVCAITEHTTNAEKILSNADTACEIARSSGGNGIHTHSVVIDEQLSDGHEKERDEAIRKTVEDKRFYLAYQPIISLAGNKDKRYEALLRVVDEEGHSILPGQFLELAEKYGLISEIDYWIFETAFSKIAEQREKDEDITVFLKLSRPTLADPQLPTWILNKLEAFGLPPSSIVFQIQEIDSINDLKSAITFAKTMKKAGCKVALEHFGVNNQPQLLKHVPADILKIDGSLTENLASNKQKQSRIREIIKIAHELGTQCIAERVDNPGSLAILWQHEIDMIQGNFVQEPDRELTYDFEGEIA